MIIITYIIDIFMVSRGSRWIDLNSLIPSLTYHKTEVVQQIFPEIFYLTSLLCEK